MKIIVKVGLGAVVLVAAAAAGAVLFAQVGSERKLHRIVAVDLPQVAIRTDADALQRGLHLYNSRGCADCHGRDGAGKVFLDDGNGFVIRGPNITTGRNSAVANYSDADWLRTIRHGVKPNGDPLIVMPSEDYNRMTAADLGSLIGYLKSLPPTDGEGRIVKLPLIVRFAYAAGIVKDAAEKIDHSLPLPQGVPLSETAAYGAYVANICLGCHGEGFAGGKIAGAPPDWPPAANLTPVSGGAMTRYPTPEALAQMLRSGMRPDGSAIKVMPFESLRELDDGEVAALYAYFRSLPPKQN